MSNFFLKVGQQVPAKGTRIENYIIGDLLIETNCSYICQAFDERTGEKIIMKIVADYNDAEIDLVTQLNHPNIIYFRPIVEMPPFHLIPMSFCEYGSALDLLMNCEDYKYGFPEPLARIIFYQMASALQYLHHQGIWHRDIKPDNILISQLNPPSAILSDFGFAIRVPEGTVSQSDSFLGTPEYAPREIHQHIEYGAFSDVYSLGVTLFVMLTKRYPLPLPPAPGEPDRHNFYGRLDRGRFMYSLLDKKGMYMAKDLIQKMCNPDPEKRLTIDEVLMHEWVQPAVKTPAENDISKFIFPGSDDEDMSQNV